MADDDKRAELLLLARHELGMVPDELTATASASSSQVEPILDAFLKITEPEYTVKPMSTNTELFRMRVGTSGPEPGVSVKPGRIVFSWKRLMEVVPEVVLGGVGIEHSTPWLWPFIGLKMVAKVYAASKEPIGDIEAAVLYVLWKNRDARNEISEQDGFERVNQLRQQYKKTVLSKTDYQIAVNRLVTLSCLKIVAGRLRLIEWVSITYT